MTDLDAATLTAYGEARGEPILGVIAVLQVIRTRVASGHWGATWTAVCLAPAQFSCWLPSDANAPILAQAAAQIGRAFNPVLDTIAWLAAQILAGAIPDVTGGATHYFAPAGVTSAPAWSRPPAVYTVTIGRHQFYRHVA